jgi:hypothetical protein
MRERSKWVSRIWSRSPWLVLGIAGSSLAPWGCANQAKCDPGFELEGSSCARANEEMPQDPDGASGAGGAPSEPASCDPPEVCPAGWSCFDLSAIDPSYPPLGVAP